MERSSIFKFRSLERPDVEEVIRLLATCFCQFDPMEVVLEITETEFIEMVRLDLEQIFADALSYVLEDPATGEILAVGVALDATTRFTDSSGKITKKFVPVAAIVNRLHHPYLESLQPQRGETAYLYMAAVHRGHQGKGIATALFKKIEHVAMSRHYRRIFTISTNIASAIALERTGFVRKSTIRYHDFIYQGQRVFEDLRASEILVLMEKLI